MQSHRWCVVETSKVGVRLSQGKLWTVLKYTRLPSEWRKTKESVGKRNLNKQEKKMSPKYSKKGLIAENIFEIKHKRAFGTRDAKITLCN